VSLGIRGIYRSILRREDIDSKQHPKRCKLPPMLDGYAETLAAANAATMSQTSRGVNEHLKGFRDCSMRTYSGVGLKRIGSVLGRAQNL
jgi:hypothetical protein